MKRSTFRGPCHTTQQQSPLTFPLFLIGPAYRVTSNESVCYQRYRVRKTENDPLYYETILKNLIMRCLPLKVESQYSLSQIGVVQVQYKALVKFIH